MSKGGMGSLDAIRAIWKLARAYLHSGFKSEQVMRKLLTVTWAVVDSSQFLMSMTNQVEWIPVASPFDQIEWIPIASPFAKSQSPQAIIRHQVNNDAFSSSFSPSDLFVYATVTVFAYGHVCMEGRGQPAKVGSLLPPCEFPGPNWHLRFGGSPLYWPSHLPVFF